MIHTDFERGFIRAETIAYDDYVALGGEAGARDAGRFPPLRAHPPYAQAAVFSVPRRFQHA